MCYGHECSEEAGRGVLPETGDMQFADSDELGESSFPSQEFKNIWKATFMVLHFWQSKVIAIIVFAVLSCDRVKQSCFPHVGSCIATPMSQQRMLGQPLCCHTGL